MAELFLIFDLDKRRFTSASIQAAGSGLNLLSDVGEVSLGKGKVSILNSKGQSLIDGHQATASAPNEELDEVALAKAQLDIAKAFGYQS